MNLPILQTTMCGLSAEIAGDPESALKTASSNPASARLISSSPFGVVRKAGIGLPAKSRAPALVAGWAPRISQKPDLGARLFLHKISVLDYGKV
jgi:hypothetical protein